MNIKNNIAVVLAGDDQYAMPLTVTIYSIIKNLSEDSDITFYLLDGGISDKNKGRLEKVIQTQKRLINCTFEWINPNLAKIKDLSVSVGYNLTVYLRFLIPDSLPDYINKVIYLDCDLIVKKDINELWGTDLEGQILGAVQNASIPYVSSLLGIDKYDELGLKPDTPYFNSGVLLINLDLWRSEQISKKAMEYVNKYKEYLHLNDQEALNAVLGGAWKQLDSRWNQQPNILNFSNFANFDCKKIINCDYEMLINQPYIIHYCIRHKPWQFNCQHPDQSKFISYLKECGWFSESEFTHFIEDLYSERLDWLFKNSKQALSQIEQFIQKIK